jgi:hypothetical protein
VLTKFGVRSINQDEFLKEFTRGDKVHIEDLITRVKAAVRRHYERTGVVAKENEFEPFSMAELRSTDYFSMVHHQIRQTGTSVDTQDLLRQFRSFDGAGTGVIKVYLLINVLKHNYPSIFSDECLLGLQF